MDTTTVRSGAEPEDIIEPELPIIDAHHHLWIQPESLRKRLDESTTMGGRALAPVFRRNARYTLDEYLADVRTGHNVRASVFVEGHSMYRSTGPEKMRSVGEIEFVNGIADMAANGFFGPVRVAAAIVGGGIDLTLGDEVEEILHAHIRAGGDRYRGLRSSVFYDSDPDVSGGMGRPHVLLDAKFRAGFRHLHPLGLSFDAYILEPQLPDLIDLARAFRETQIILNHLGTPLGVGQYAGKRAERFAWWRDHMRALSRCSNVFVKLGGIGMFYAGFGYHESTIPITSARMAEDWRPYIETCIEAFGVTRCMFESNFPVDSGACSYAVLWNAFKRITSGATQAERNALFMETAAQVYRLDVSSTASHGKQ